MHPFYSYSAPSGWQFFRRPVALDLPNAGLAGEADVPGHRGLRRRDELWAAQIASRSVVGGRRRAYRRRMRGAAGCHRAGLCAPAGARRGQTISTPGRGIREPDRAAGYDDPSPTAQPGDETTLRLYWRLPQPAGRNYSVFVHLVDENGVIVAQRDMHPGQGSIATSEIEPGYMWTDFYTLRIPRTALAPGRLHWEAGVYDQSTGQRLPLTSVGGRPQGQGQGQGQGEDAIRLGALELRERPAGGAPLLDYRNGITLSDYGVEPRSPLAGDSITVTLSWRAAQDVTQDYTVSLQLLDEQGGKIGQHDGVPAGGGAPTSSWRAGALITDTHVFGSIRLRRRALIACSSCCTNRRISSGWDLRRQRAVCGGSGCPGKDRSALSAPTPAARGRGIGISFRFSQAA